LGNLARLLAGKWIALFSDGDVRRRKEGGKEGEISRASILYTGRVYYGVFVHVL
jgi:hypothetical protein